MAYDFLKIYDTSNSTIEKLTFTIQGHTDPNLTNLTRLLNLRKLKIYYSAYQSQGNLITLMNILKYMPPIEVIFVEYYKPPPSDTFHSDLYLEELRKRSIACRSLLCNLCPNAIIEIQKEYPN